MSAAGLSAIGPLPRGRARRAAGRAAWRRPGLVLSLLLHLLALWWLFVGLPPRRMPEPSAPSAVDVVYEGGAPEDLPAPPAEGAPAPLEPPSTGALPIPPSPMPRVAEPPPDAAPRVAEAPPAPPGAPLLPPAPQATPPVPAPPSAAPPSPPPLAQAPPSPPPPALALPQPVPPMARALPPVPLPSQPAPAELSMPPAPPPAETPREAEMAALPLPPPPAPEPPAEPAQARAVPTPRPTPPQQAQSRPRPASPFAGALDLSQGPPVALGRPSPPSAPGSSGTRRDRDAAAAVASPQADAPNAQLRIRGANLGADWRSAFMAWLREHGYYPRQAVEAGEDGTAVVRFTVDRTGRVSGLQLIGRSGSIWLDAGAQALLRGRSVPPFPTSTREDSAEIDLTINYILRRH